MIFLIETQTITVNCNIEKCFERSSVFIRNLNIYILAIYRFPTGNFDTFLSTVENLLSNLGTDKPVILAGDFNVRFGSNEENAINLCDTFVSFGISQTIHAATRQNSCLDNIFVGTGTDVIASDIVDLNISDHMGQIVDLSISIGNDVVQNKKVCRPMTQRGMLRFHYHI